VKEERAHKKATQLVFGTLSPIVLPLFQPLIPSSIPTNVEDGYVTQPSSLSCIGLLDDTHLTFPIMANECLSSVTTTL